MSVSVKLMRSDRGQCPSTCMWSVLWRCWLYPATKHLHNLSNYVCLLEQWKKNIKGQPTDPPQYSPGMKTIRMLCVSVVVEHMSRMRSVTAMWQWQHCHLVDIVSTVHNSPTMFKVCIFSSYRIIQCRRINFVLPGWATSQHHTTVKCFYL